MAGRRTLFFLSVRDSQSRAPSSRRRRPGPLPPSSANADNPKGKARDPFVIYDEEEDEEDASERGRLLPSSGGQKSNGGHVRIDMDKLPPAWVELADNVERILAAVVIKISALDKLHAKHALPGFADRTAEERDIERMTTEITRDFRQCHSLIQKVKAEPTPIATTASPNQQHTFPPRERQMKPPSAHEVLAAKNVQRGLAAKVQETSALFRKKQKVYMDRLQGHAIKNQDLLIASGAISLHGSEGLSAVEEDMAAAQQQQQQQLDVQTQARTRELAEIAKNIASLADLFKDLSSLVIEQGTILDSVEYNIERTADAMEGAVKELKIAQGYQRNTGRRQCIFFLLLLIFAAIVVLIFKPRRH
ncbi:related to the member of the syntaxin family of t-SNAREs TLG2 [Serendipita indica DSM 11827]|uniref:Related to the member of the syntaxin family of t-SNAREs TLG2 n=1 Tax=Serendipita indica (strain DSM 11827) TaxID=1109443 RepID=G4TT60_SERID|nr:related to the member of the syntaxin family of t-SNAREs TLG2 [Serendipita indica DSM 11827]